MGQAGEAAVRAAVDVGPKTVIQIAGRTRIPDGLTSTVLSEVKNAAYVPYSQQLRDFATFARQTGRRFELYVRPGADIAQPLLDARAQGIVNIIPIPGL